MMVIQVRFKRFRANKQLVSLIDHILSELVDMKLEIEKLEEKVMESTDV